MAVGSGRDDHCSLDSTIGTLKRCLKIVSGDVNLETCNSNEESPSSHVTSPWPRDQHMFSQDDLVGNERSQTIKVVDYKAYDTVSKTYVGAVVCKLDRNAEGRRKGYLAMLAIDESCRRLGLGTRLVRRAIERMEEQGCDEVVLETEVSNVNAQRLYNNLGFIREKRLVRYYLNGGDAFRLKLYFSSPTAVARKASYV
ncbi:acetyltransferase, GNAT family [Necator americanus]|uniref:Acetyltransferase, GNAT family n=1 Tax=Necator americanus TaxID=51031 RepID=W2T0Y3_NECAM|nr:acetyltransferase, GNAT family [Necator americanus]ETN75558.1 acetyltransferase, GNAT family [Necator americanus]